MIHYQLRCAETHEFDGWFPSSSSFEAQAAAGLLTCPRCGGHRVERALMAPALPRAVQREAPSASAPGDARPPEAVTPSAALKAVAPIGETPQATGRAERMAVALPDQVRAALHRLRREVERRCDYVGDTFAAEARRIHDGQSPARGIYGEATPAEAEALADDGIEVSRIPWLPRLDT